MTTVACLGAFPVVALSCVEICVVAEEVPVVEVLVAVCWWLIGVLSDAVSGVRYGRVYQTWCGIGVAELGGAAVAPWFSFFVGGGGVGDVRAAWCVPRWCCAASLRLGWWGLVRWAVSAGMRSDARSDAGGG